MPAVFGCRSSDGLFAATLWHNIGVAPARHGTAVGLAVPNLGAGLVQKLETPQTTTVPTSTGFSMPER